MATFKNITIPKRGGGTRKQRVQVLASGKYKFVKNLKSNPKKKKVNTKKRRNNPRMAKKNNLRRAKSFLNVNTLMKIDRAVAFLAPRARAVMIPSTPHGKLDAYVATVSGYNMANGSWNWDSLVSGWLPYLATSVVSKGIGKINGIIRRL